MMSDEQPENTEAPVKRGRPKGAKTKSRKIEREPLHQPVHRGVHADDEIEPPLENFEWRPFEAMNPLHIDHDTVRNIEREWGYSLLWCMETVHGKAFPDRINWRKKNGFAEVKKGNFGGCLDHMADRDGRIAVEGLVLLARPAAIEQRARAYERKQALSAVTQMQASHATQGADGITMPDGARHPSALEKNRHRQTFEPGPKIPD